MTTRIISIAEDGMWATMGTVGADGRTIEHATVRLGNGTPRSSLRAYAAIEDAIANGRGSVEAEGRTYSWAFTSPSIAA